MPAALRNAFSSQMRGSNTLTMALAFGALILTVVILPLIYDISIGQTFWGLFYIAEFSTGWRWLFALVPVLCALSAAVAMPILRPYLERPVWSLRLSILISILLAIAGAFLFWTFREHRHFGDGLTTARFLDRNDMFSIRHFYWRSPLDRLIVVNLHRWLHMQFQFDGLDSIAFMSTAAGSIFIAVLFLFSRHVAKTVFTHIWLFAFVLTMGAIQLFFGHVENYSLVSVLLLAYISTAIKYLQGSSSLWCAGLTAAMATTAHPLAGFSFPSLLVLPFLRLGLTGATFADFKRDRERTKSILRTWLISMLPGILYFAAFYAVSQYLLEGAPIELGFNSFANATVLGWSEPLIRKLQGLLLILPAGGLVIAIHFAHARICNFSREWTPTLQFLMVLTFSFLFYYFFLDNTRDRSSDWDLFAPAGIPWAIFAGVAFLPQLEESWDHSVLAVFIVGYSLAFTAPWVISNWISTAII